MFLERDDMTGYQLLEKSFEKAVAARQTILLIIFAIVGSLGSDFFVELFLPAVVVKPIALYLIFVWQLWLIREHANTLIKKNETLLESMMTSFVISIKGWWYFTIRLLLYFAVMRIFYSDTLVLGSEKIDWLCAGVVVALVLGYALINFFCMPLLLAGKTSPDRNASYSFAYLITSFGLIVNFLIWFTIMWVLCFLGIGLVAFFVRVLSEALGHAPAPVCLIQHLWVSGMYFGGLFIYGATQALWLVTLSKEKY